MGIVVETPAAGRFGSTAPGIVRPSPVQLPDFTRARRDPIRPIAYRDQDFLAKFDGETLFYDAFHAADGRIVLVGPAFLNLRSALEGATLFASPGGVPCRFEVRTFDRHGQVHVDAPAGTASLRLSSALGAIDIAVQPDESRLYRGRRVLFTLSKNNRLRWIQDWIRFSRDVHGADAVLIYDNGSTAYSASDLLAAINAVDGIAVARVVEWPFKYGPQGLDARRFWDSDFAQLGMLEHGRRRFLSAAASVQVSDIDELVVAPQAESVFVAAERSRFGIVRYAGRWVVGIEGSSPSRGFGDRRHADYSVALRPRPGRRFGVIPVADADRCPPKWTIVPARCPDRAQWRVHGVSHHLPARLVTSQFSFRHFKELTDNWKYERTGREAFDPARHEDDQLLRSHFARVNWDR